MERIVAVKKLGKLLGKSLGYRIDSKAPTPEERVAAKEASTAALVERNKLKDRKRARFEAILKADDEYQTLAKEEAAASKKLNELYSITRHYKISVGVSNSMFFHVKAEGDSWEEVIAKLETKKTT